MFLSDEQMKIQLKSVCRLSVKFDLKFKVDDKTLTILYFIVDDSNVFKKVSPNNEEIKFLATSRFLNTHAIIEFILKNSSNQLSKFNLIFCLLRYITDNEFRQNIRTLKSLFNENRIDPYKAHMIILSREYYETRRQSLTRDMKLLEKILRGKNLLSHFGGFENGLNIRPLHLWTLSTSIYDQFALPITKQFVKNIFCETCEYCKTGRSYLEQNNKIIEISDEEFKKKYLIPEIIDELEKIENKSREDIENERKKYI